MKNVIAWLLLGSLAPAVYVLDFYRYISIGAIMSSPAVDQGVVYVGSMDGNLYALY